jgi:hypothetical protein
MTMMPAHAAPARIGREPGLLAGHIHVALRPRRKGNCPGFPSGCEVISRWEARKDTAQILMAPSEPYNESEFLKIWLENDKTVLCVRGENKTPVPPWVDIENPDGELFQSTHVGYRHGPREQAHLIKLHERRRRG